jgi:hypothetical protein
VKISFNVLSLAAYCYDKKVKQRILIRFSLVESLALSFVQPLTNRQRKTYRAHLPDPQDCSILPNYSPLSAGINRINKLFFGTIKVSKWHFIDSIEHNNRAYKYIFPDGFS